MSWGSLRPRVTIISRNWSSSILPLPLLPPSVVGLTILHAQFHLSGSITRAQLQKWDNQFYGKLLVLNFIVYGQESYELLGGTRNILFMWSAFYFFLVYKKPGLLYRYSTRKSWCLVDFKKQDLKFYSGLKEE